MAGTGAGAATVGAAIGACNGAATEAWAILGEDAVAAGMEAGAGAACMPLAASRVPAALRCDDAERGKAQGRERGNDNDEHPHSTLHSTHNYRSQSEA